MFYLSAFRKYVVLFIVLIEYFKNSIIISMFLIKYFTILKLYGTTCLPEMSE